mgnify:CR=1 FL=1
MEIIFQERNGERQLEIWNGGKKVCTCVDVADQRAIEAMVNGGAE